MASGIRATVAGGSSNTASGLESTVAGGVDNTAGSTASTVGGGTGNTASVAGATVGGGGINTASGNGATIGGGTTNQAIGDSSTVGGGRENFAIGQISTVSGGMSNSADGLESVIGGGLANVAFAAGDTVGGGNSNTASGSFSTVAGGIGNDAIGVRSTVPGGEFNEASGDFSFAAGRQAKATHVGSFVWADSTNAPFASTAADQFSIRAAGGVRIVGDVSANNFEYSSPESRKMKISPLGFTPRTGASFFEAGGGGAVLESQNLPQTAAGTGFYAVTGLPDGADITKFSCAFIDKSTTSDANFSCKLMGHPPNFLPTQAIVLSTNSLASSGSSSSKQFVTDTSITNSIIDEDNFYWIELEFNPDGTDCSGLCQFYEVIIEYEVSKAD